MSAGTAYSKRFAGGFQDLPAQTTEVDQQFLNAVEAALLQLIGSAPTADGQVAQWDFANTRFGPALLLNKNVDAAAAIAKSKLDFTGANGIVNADVAGAAAIARSKLNFGTGLVDADIAAAAAIQASKISGLYTGPTTYRKTTAKNVTNTVAETDLLNGEITVAANAMGASGVAKLMAYGDWIQNSGVGALNLPVFALKLGGAATIVIKSPPGAGTVYSSAARYGWMIEVTIANLGATNSQWISFKLVISNFYSPNSTAINPSLFTTGEGVLDSLSAGNGATGQAVSTGEAGNSAAIDTTAAMDVLLTVINPTATATCETKLYGALVEVA